MKYDGILFIGDPHLCSRVPGFRSDDYPDAILNKLAWCFDYAEEHSLKTALLGDLFHFPRDNANWLLTKIIRLMSRNVPLAIYGNHDVAENTLAPDDSLSVVAASGAITLVEDSEPWQGTIAGRNVVIGGTSWGRKLPTECSSDSDHTFWMTHHDLLVPGYEEFGRWRPKPLPGIEAVINGHIHRRLETVRYGDTQWITPGNISRVNRGDATREHIPAVLRIEFTDQGWGASWITVPHGEFDSVFYEQILSDDSDEDGSSFIQGLAEMKARRTASGAGLREFLTENLAQFDQDVQNEINALADKVLRT